MSQTQKRPQPASALVEEQETTSTKVTSDQIALRAYQIYQERGDNPGSDLEDWLEAERQLNQPAA